MCVYKSVCCVRARSLTGCAVCKILALDWMSIWYNFQSHIRNAPICNGTHFRTRFDSIPSGVRVRPINFHNPIPNKKKTKKQKISPKQQNTHQKNYYHLIYKHIYTLHIYIYYIYIYTHAVYVYIGIKIIHIIRHNNSGVGTGGCSGFSFFIFCRTQHSHNWRGSERNRRRACKTDKTTI